MYEVIFYKDKNGNEPIKGVENMRKINDIEYTTLNDLWDDPALLTADDKDRINFEVSLIGKLIEARELKGLTQKELADKAGIKQSAVARLESLKATPQIDTLFKVLKPLGYTLEIVPDRKQMQK
ncbi:MAG: helix-turn-helix transcriptional regulator [Synergistaceae bacterium]|nr:helix-turn-helix transcriptional regulator [Synergistaceae bacterium]